MSFDPHALPVPDLGLLCLKCRYPLAGLPNHRCPECGRTFDIEEHIPKGDFPVVIVKSKEVPLTPDIMDLIQAYRIPFMDAAPRLELGFGNKQSIHSRSCLAVPRDCYFEVIDLLRRRDSGEPMPEPPAAADGPDWSCDACGESNPVTFEMCWNCGAPMTAAANE